MPLDHNKPPQDSASPDRETGDRLRLARENLGFTQAAVANRTRMKDPEGKGVSRTALVGYEQGSTRPGLREIRLLCEVLSITPNWLIFGDLSATLAALPSLQLTALGAYGELDAVLRTAIALTALKGHERDSLHSLALSLAGRQLGDERLSALVAYTFMMREPFIKALQDVAPELQESATLEQLADALSRNGMRTNLGNRFRFNEEGDMLNEDRAVYPDPEKNKS